MNEKKVEDIEGFVKLLKDDEVLFIMVEKLEMKNDIMLWMKESIVGCLMNKWNIWSERFVYIVKLKIKLMKEKFWVV